MGAAARRTEERKVGLGEPAHLKEPLQGLQVEPRHRRDDAQVEAVGVGGVLAQPPVRERHKDKAKAVFQRLDPPAQRGRRHEGLGRQVLPPLQPAAALLQRHDPAAAQGRDGAALDRPEQRGGAKVGRRRPLREPQRADVGRHVAHRVPRVRVIPATVQRD